MQRQHAGPVLLTALAIVAAFTACASPPPAAPSPSPAASVAVPVADCGLGFVPFEEIRYIATPAPGADIKDRVVVGRMTLANGFRLFDLPEPTRANERFCRDVTLGPGYTGPAYIPTLAEKRGDFSHTRALLVDPITGHPLPGNIIPSYYSPGVVGWRIPPS